MRVILLLLFLPCLIQAGCGCEQVEKELAKERKEDGDKQGCRSCKTISPSITACPTLGYLCDTAWGFTSNVLTAADPCQCAEARCAGNAKLALDGAIVNANKLRCNNSQWEVNGKAANPIICAKFCDKGACQDRHPRATSDFVPLTVKPASFETSTRCATAVCEPANGLATINADGSLGEQLGAVTSLDCTGDGEWNGAGKYVMCNASPCGPSNCAPFVFGPGVIIGEAMSLEVKGNGKECATATCPGAFLHVDGNGVIQETSMVGVTSLTCQTDGSWASTEPAGTYPFAMCATPPCASTCDRAPLETSSLGGNELITPTRSGCSFSCPEGMSMFRQRSIEEGGDAPISIASATCTAEGYLVNGNQAGVERIGCYKCDRVDGPLADTVGSVKAVLKNCVTKCPEGYKLKIQLDNGSIFVGVMYRFIMGQTPNAGFFVPAGIIDPARSVISYECIAN